MKVLYLSPYFSSFIHGQVCNLNQLGIVPYAAFGYGWWEKLRNKNLKALLSGKNLSQQIPQQQTHIFYHPSTPKMIDYPWWGWYWYVALKHLQKKHQFDLIHAHTLYQAGYAGYLLAKKWGIPLVVTSHGVDFYRCLPQYAQYRAQGLYSAGVKKRVEKVLNNAQAVIAVSNGYGQDIIKAYPNTKVEVIENSFNHALFTPGNRQQARNKLNLNQKATYLLTVGGFTLTKGHKYLLQSFKQLVNKFTGLRLILIGGGELTSQYKSFCQQNNIANYVEIIPAVSHSSLVDYYRAADIFVFPSLSESFGVSLIEAMACGLPAVATNAAGPRSIITNAQNGLLTDIANNQQLTNAISSLLQNTNLRQQLATQGPLTARQYKNKDHLLPPLYNKILGNS